MTGAQGPVVIRRRLGTALKQLRVERGLHLQGVASQLEISPSKLSRLETGLVTPRIRDVRDLLQIYDAPADTQDRILQWAHEAKEPGWWKPFSAAIPAYLDLYISLETEARAIRMYSIPVAGLLQTEAYARMLLTAAAPDAAAEELHQVVGLRMRRQVVIDPDRQGAPPLDLHVVLDETALHRGTDERVMIDQLATLLHRATLPNITLQVLPFDAGFATPSSTFAIFEPRHAADGIVVNVESAGQDAYFDTPGEIAKYDRMWDDVTRRALDPRRSIELIRAVHTSYAERGQ